MRQRARERAREKEKQTEKQTKKKLTRVRERKKIDEREMGVYCERE